jgi:cyanophycin synthetase
VVLRETRHGEMMTIIEHRRDTSLLLASQIPATFDGRNRANVANALAAAAAALGADVQLEAIRQALRTFTASYFQTPGRFNLLEFDGRRILMDYCHNAHGLESMVDFVKRMTPKRAIALIAMPGDRSNDDIAKFGELAGRSFDRIIIREDVNTRGRARGEVAGLLQEAVMRGGLAEDSVSMVLEEPKAVDQLVGEAERDDFVVLLVDEPTKIWETLTNMPGMRSVV